MKRFLLAIALFFCALTTNAQIKTITGGGFQKPDGTACVGCVLFLQLSSDATVSGTGQIIHGTPKSYILDASGNVPANSTIWGNDQFTATATYYAAALTFPGGGGTIWGPIAWSLIGTSPINLSQVIAVNPSPIGIPNPALLAANNAFTGNNTFSGTTLVKNLENSWFYEDQFAGATVGARVSAALLSGCATAACTVVIPATEASTEVLGNLTTNPTATQIILDLRNSGPGGTQATNWLLCDFLGTAADSACRNSGGPQAFQVGRTFNNSPVNGNNTGTFWAKFTGVSTNTLGFPLASLVTLTEMNGLTQSNGTPAPLVGLDLAVNIQGNNTNIPEYRYTTCDPGGLANAGTGNTITTFTCFHAPVVANALPAGLTIPNYRNAYLAWPKIAGITNAWSLISEAQTWISDGLEPGSGAKELLRIRGPLSGGGARTGDMFQVTDSANGDANVFQILGSPAGLMVARKNAQILQGANGNDALFLQRFTDTSPAGLFIHAQTAAASDVFDVDVTGKITSETGLAPTGNGALVRATSPAISSPTITGTDSGAASFTGINNFPGNTVALTADWTCGTGGTVSSCVAATIIGSGGGIPLTFTLPLVAQSYTLECDGVVGQATAATANQWNLLTATNGVTNTMTFFDMYTAAAVKASGVTTGQGSTTTTFAIGGTWTLGATATKMPFHIYAKLEGTSASGTVVSIQLVAPTVGDLVTIYRGTACRLF